MAEAFFARLPFDGVEFADLSQHPTGVDIVVIQCLLEVAAHVGHAPDQEYPLALLELLVGGVAICLQPAFVIAQHVYWPRAAAAGTVIEEHQPQHG